MKITKRYCVYVNNLPMKYTLTEMKAKRLTAEYLIKGLRASWAELV